MTPADLTALLLASGIHPCSRLPLGTPGDRCAGCVACVRAGEGHVCARVGREVRPAWRSCVGAGRG